MNEFLRSRGAGSRGTEPTGAHHTVPFLPEGLLFLGCADGQSAHFLAYWAEIGNSQEEELWLNLQTGEPVEEAPYDLSGAYDQPLPS